MRALTSAWIRGALGLGDDRGGPEFRGVSIDSRTVAPGELFVALPGERVDGADYLSAAADAGATGAIVAEGREDASLELEYFLVTDPYAALFELGAACRAESTARVIAVTGSSGKTTVKEMIAAALSPSFAVYGTPGNLNSQIGLPLTILRSPEAADVWVLEVGTSEPGEISRLTAAARPDDAVVTTVGAAHLEAFGDESRVLDEKLDLVRGASSDGAVVVGELPTVLGETALSLRGDTVIAGIGAPATFRPDRHQVRAESVSFERAGVRFEVGVGGEHHLRDALMAVAIAESLGVPALAAAEGLARYEPVGHRGAVVEIGGLTVLADCYNANPESFRAAIAQCRDLYDGRPLAAFVGSMLELGDREASEHLAIATELLDAGFSPIAATGAFASAFEGARGSRPAIEGAGGSDAASMFADETPETVWDDFASALGGDEVVLVKASRGARLERVLDWLDERFGETNGNKPGGGR